MLNTKIKNLLRSAKTSSKIKASRPIRTKGPSKIVSNTPRAVARRAKQASKALDLLGDKIERRKASNC